MIGMQTYWTVIGFDGDYAVLVSDTGLENRVALALLPDNITDGTRLLRDFLEYSIIDQ